jgi:ABC-type nickel/cobalt efflux system permease component RcnA
MINSKFKTQNSKLKWLVPLGILVCWMALPLVASAHPLGNFTVNSYSRLEIGAAGVKVYYVLDMAEIPTFQEKDQLDLNHDGQLSDSERQSYLDHKAAEIAANLKLTIDNAPAELKLVDKTLNFLDGQGGLQTMRLTAHLETAALAANAASLIYRDFIFSDRLGWKEIVVRNATGVAIQQSSASSADQSNELRTYPQDMLASPLSITSAQVSFKLDPGVIVNSSGGVSASGGAVYSDDPFASLIKGGELTLGVILVALLVAIGLGAVHALSPGHGKTVVAAYLVGSRGTAKHALFLGLTVTITHTIGVFALGLITLFASQFILPEKLYPWLGLASGLLVVGMGLNLFRSRLRYALGKAKSGVSTHSHADHDHDHSHADHDHHHNHDHDHHDHVHAEYDHHHDHAHEESHAPVLEYAYALQPTVPANTTAHSNGEPGNHTHSHEVAHTHHTYSHLDHDHHEHDHTHAHDHSALSTQHSALTHSHGGKEHTHLPPGADGTEVTWKRLLLFGISAGLLPCPSALVVMLSAIALNRTAFGLILIIFFSLGLAGTLTGIGLMLVYARKLLAKVKLNSTTRILRIVPVASALLIAILGIAISYEALLQTGLLNR